MGSVLISEFPPALKVQEALGIRTPSERPNIDGVLSGSLRWSHSMINIRQSCVVLMFAALPCPWPRHITE